MSNSQNKVSENHGVAGCLLNAKNFALTGEN
jgi:hypothetical protein